MSDKLDVKKLDRYRAPHGAFRILELPPVDYLMIDGEGDPNTRAFSEAVEALYPLAYTLKFASKRDGVDYVVPPLEGLWWADDMTTFTSARDKSRWSWTLMLFVPEWIGEDAVEAARSVVRAKQTPPARVGDIRFETLQEGLSVQTLHVGSFDDEAPVLARLHDEFIPQNGLRMTGRHHEIYLADPRRTSSEKLRTILRQPVSAI